MCGYKFLCIVMLVCWCCLFRCPRECVSINAYPKGVPRIQPDGSPTPHLYLHGEHQFSFLTDSDGYHVIQDENGWYLYDTLQPINSTTNSSSSSSSSSSSATGDYRVERGRPQGALLGSLDALTRHRPAIPNHQHQHQHQQHQQHQQQQQQQEERSAGRTEGGNGTKDGRHRELLQNDLSKGDITALVIPIRFSNHKNRILPPPHDLEILMNWRGPSIHTPTGSVRDVFHDNSYGLLNIFSRVYNQWIDLPHSESYYAANFWGVRNPTTRSYPLVQGLEYALNLVDADPNFSFASMDTNKDQKFDVVVFFHSGYGGEFGDHFPSCSSLPKSQNRIWSHKGGLYPYEQIHTTKKSNNNNNKLTLDNFVIVSALWEPCSTEMARVGVVSHELGHIFGLQDLYDDLGFGFVFDFMSQGWGFDNQQRAPMKLSSYSKELLGWINPKTAIPSSSKAGKTFTLRSSSTQKDAYRIIHGFHQSCNKHDDVNCYDEYLLLEHWQYQGTTRYKKSFQGGIAIWKIDLRKPLYMSGGYPGSQNWPNNGQHARVSLLQADGLYDIERRKNHGHENDLWRQGSNSLLPGNSDGPYPNTDSYSGQQMISTGISITNFQKINNNKMSFDLSLYEDDNKSNRMLHLEQQQGSSSFMDHHQLQQQQQQQDVEEEQQEQQRTSLRGRTTRTRITTRRITEG